MAQFPPVVGWFCVEICVEDPAVAGGPIFGVAGEDMETGDGITPPELDGDSVRSTTGLILFWAALFATVLSSVALSSVAFGEIFLSLAGSIEDDDVDDVCTVNLLALGDSHVRSTSDVVILSCTLGLLFLFWPCGFEKLCLPEKKITFQP